jgi:hypothetical protein
MIISKNSSQLCSNHASQRAEERYNTETDPILVNGLLSRIRIGKGKVLRRLPDNSRIVYSVRFRKKSFTIVVNNTLDSIITFLPQGSTGFYANRNS